MFGIYMALLGSCSLFVCHMKICSFTCAGNDVGKVDAGLDTLLEEAMFLFLHVAGWGKMV